MLKKERSDMIMALERDGLNPEVNVKKKRNGRESALLFLSLRKSERGNVMSDEIITRCIPERANTWETPFALPFSSIPVPAESALPSKSIIARSLSSSSSDEKRVLRKSLHFLLTPYPALSPDSST